MELVLGVADEPLYYGQGPVERNVLLRQRRGEVVVPHELLLVVILA